MKRKYGILFAALVGLLVILVDSRNPFGPDFPHRIVPAAVLLAAMQWLLLPIRAVLRVVGTVATIAIAALFAEIAGGIGVDFPRFAAIVVTLVSALVLILLRPSSDRPTVHIIVGQSLGLGFLLLLGRYMNERHVSFHIAADGRFLFWSPLAAMSLWIEAAIFGWSKWSRGLFLILLGLIALGFLDVGMGQGVALMTAFAIVFFVAALVLLIFWAEKLYPTKKAASSRPQV